MPLPILCGDSLVGCSTPPEPLQKLPEAGRKYKACRHWDRSRIGRSQQDITGAGFNAIRSDPRKPAHTIRRMDSTWEWAAHWSERRRFSLPEFKRFGSFPDGFTFAGEFEEGFKQIGNCVPPLFMRAIAEPIQFGLLG